MPPLCRLLRLNCSKAQTLRWLDERIVETPEDLSAKITQLTNVTGFFLALKFHILPFKALNYPPKF